MTREQAKILWDKLEAILQENEKNEPGSHYDVDLIYEEICDIQNLLNQVE